MSRLLTAVEIGAPICEALGLDGKLVRSLTLTLRAGEMPELIVEQWIRGDDDKIAALIGPVFSRYELTPKEPKP